jgi:hypothetical protein
MRIKIHPDGYVRVRDGEMTLYLATLAEFEQDAGIPVPPLPEQMVMAEYDTEAHILRYTDAQGNAHPVPGETEWAFGDMVAKRIDEIVAAKQARIAREVETPSLEMAAAVEPVAPQFVGMPVAKVRKIVEEF